MSRVRRIRRKKNRTAGAVWKRLLLWGVLGIFVMCVAAVSGCYLYVRYYLKSEQFLTLLEQSAIDELNVNRAEIQPLEWDGSGIQCDGVTMEGREFLSFFHAKKIETEFSRWDLLKRTFVITSVNIAEASLSLSEESFHIKEKEEEPKSWVEKNILPDTFRLEKGNIDSLNVSYGNHGNEFVLKGARVESSHDSASDQYRFNIQGGRLTLPFQLCPEFSLMSGTAQFNPSTLRLNIPSCRLTTDVGGYLDIKGDWDGVVSSWTANIVVNSIPASSILEDDWKKHIQGTVSGGVDLRGDQRGITHVAGLVRLQNGVLTGLPILDRLALFCDSARFRQLPLHKASAQFRYKGTTLSVSDIILESEQLVKVEGWLDIGENGVLNGRLQIGLRADGVWKNLPGVSEVFSASRTGSSENLMWANVNIGGTVDHPSEDLSARLIKAAGKRVMKNGMNTVKEKIDIAARLLNKNSTENKKDGANEKEEGLFDVPATDRLPIIDAAEKGLKSGSELLKGLL